MYPINQICAVEVSEYKYSSSFRIGNSIETFNQDNLSIEHARQKLQLKKGWVTFPGTVDSLINGSIHESSCIYKNERKVCYSFSAKVRSVITNRIEGVHYQIPWEDYLGLRLEFLRERNVKKVGTPISSELEETLYQEFKGNSSQK